MKNKILIILMIVICLCISGCRNYTATRKNDNKEDSSYSEEEKKADKEERDAVENAPKFSSSSESLRNALKNLDYFKVEVDNDAKCVTYKSDNFELWFGIDEIDTIYFILYDSYPMKNKALISEFWNTIKTIMYVLNTDFDKEPIIKSFNNLDYSKARDTYENNYNENIGLFSNVWNDGVKDCVDFRIIPKN